MFKKRIPSLLIPAAMAVAIFAASQPARAQTDSVGLKDVYANKFRFGTILNQTTVGSEAMKLLVLKQFNSITPENELKPDATIDCNSGCTDDNVKVSLSRAATILKFCEDNNIPVRGHTLVWHSQTPARFFKAGFSDNGAWVTKEVMNRRMESYIKNMFAAIKTQYPRLDLYAYDVVNEAAKTSASGARDPGDNVSNGQSMWVQIYGNNSFIEKAFEYARQYAPPTTKLFYNDFNEYMSAKRDYIADSIVKPLKAKNLIDGMGMQSHVETRQGPSASTSASWPSANEYGQAITRYKNLGVEVQITELDASLPSGSSNWTGQAAYYGQLMNAILNQGGDAVTAVVVWGIQDDQSWITKNNQPVENPLLFDRNGQKKPAYDTLYARIPRSQWGDGNNVGGAGGVYALSVGASPAGSGTVARNPASGSYAENAEVTLTASPGPGWVFKNWSGDASGTQASAKITMSSDKAVTANFELSGADDYNLVKNGNFTGDANWTLNKHDGSAGTIATFGGEATITMTTAPTGGVAHNFQLVQNGIALIEGYTYRLTFDAFAASARDMGVVMQMDVDPWTTYSNKTVGLTDVKQSFEHVFKMESATDENGRIAFNIGGATVAAAPAVKISNVKLVYVLDPQGPTAVAQRLRAKAGAGTKFAASRASFGVKVRFIAPQSGEATLTLYGLRGNVVSASKLQTVAGQSYAHTLNAEKLPNGFYVVSLRQGGAVQRTAVVVPK